MDREKILEEYRKIITIDSIKARDLIKKLDYKEDAFLLRCIAQTYLDESRFEADGTPREFLNWRKLKMAERYIIKAYTIDPNCSRVVYTMGSVRRSMGQTDVAIYCYDKVIKLGIRGGSSKRCPVDNELAKELINDSKFELYRLYYEDNRKLAEKYLARYKKGLEKGINSIYVPLEQFLLE